MRHPSRRKPTSSGPLLRLALVIVLGGLACAPNGCSEEKTTAGDAPGFVATRDRTGAVLVRPNPRSDATNERSSNTRTLDSARNRTASADPRAERTETATVWAVVLVTTTGDGHAQRAHQSGQFVVQQAPDLAGAWVHSTSKGSSVLYGRYTGPDDPAAQADLQRIKAIEINDRRPFALSILTRVELSPRAAATHPNDLMNLRRRYPQVDPLYTLQVAVWADDEGKMTMDQIERRAEAYAEQLRNRGYEAYFYHAPELKMSIVTVGAFDHTAIHPRSFLYSPAVRRLQQDFPNHLFNGEPVILLERGKEKEQGCQLVEVPGM